MFISSGNYLEQGVERIVDQVVNPKVHTVFKPQVEDLVYNYYGVPRPKKEDEKIPCIDLTENLLPTDLEAVSPGSVKSTNEDKEIIDITTIDDSKDMKMDVVEAEEENSKTEKENKSPTFEPITSDKIELPKEQEPLPGIIDLTLNDIDSMDIPLPQEEVKVANIPAPENATPEIQLENIELPKEPSAAEISNIPLPDEMPPQEVRDENNESEYRLIISDEDSVSSSDSSLRRNMSPITPIRNFDNDNSYDAQEAFETRSVQNSKDNVKKEPSPEPSNAFRFTIESKDSDNSNEVVDKVEKKEFEITTFKSSDIKTFSSPLLQPYEDSSNSNNLQIDYESDNSKINNESKAPEIDHNSNSSLKTKESRSDDKKNSHKSSHSSRDKNRDSKDKKVDSKHSSSKTRKDSKHDKKPSKDDSKSKSSHRDSSKDTDKKDSSKHRHSSSHKSSSSNKDSHKSSSSSHRHSSSSSKHSDDKKSSSHKDKSDSKSSKDHKASKDSSHSSRSSKDRKSSSSKSKHPDEKDKEKKDKKPVDDHYSASGRGSHSRRSTDRDSNDGNSSSSKGSNVHPNSQSSQNKKSSKSTSKSETHSSNSDTTSQSDAVEQANDLNIEKLQAIPPVVRIESHLETPLCEAPQLTVEPESSVKKPKFAPNFEEAKQLMKIRKILNAEERKKNQEAALLLEFQQNVRPGLSQVYSSIPGPELEFICSSTTNTIEIKNNNNYTVQVNIEPVVENINNEAIEENNVNCVNDHISSQNIHTVESCDIENAMFELHGEDGSNENSSIDESDDTNDIKEHDKQVSDITYELERKNNVIHDKAVDVNNDKSSNIEMNKDTNDLDNSFHFFSETEKYIAELESVQFKDFFKEFSDRNANKSDAILKKCVKDVEVTIDKELILPFKEEDNLNTDESILFSPVKSDCSYEGSDYNDKIKAMANTKSRQEIMEIILGVPEGSPDKMPKVNFGKESLEWSYEGRGMKRKVSFEHDNNNKDILSPNKIRNNNECDQITSTAQGRGFDIYIYNNYLDI